MYKVELSNQAIIFFNEFDRALQHMRGQIHFAFPRQSVSEIVESGNVFETKDGKKIGTLEKIKGVA